MEITQEPEYANEIRGLLRAIGKTPENVYAPSEDSYLMLDAIAKLAIKGKRVLDLGTGSGILGLFCAIRGAQVTVTDVEVEALQQVRKAADALGLNVELVQSNLFRNVHGKFDLILFNPPYLPSSSIDDRTVDGGREGSILARRFLAELGSYLRPEGSAILLLSSLNKPESLIEEYPEFQFSIIGHRSLFFEELQVLHVRF